MKHSIKKIFTSLSSVLLLLTFVITFMTILVVEQNTSYSRINNLINQKKIIVYLSSLNKDDIQLALIQFNGKSTQLMHEINKLKNLSKYDYTGNYILSYSEEHTLDLNKLSKLTTLFNKSAHEYYIKTLENREEKNKELNNAYYNVNDFLNEMIVKSISYAERKFKILQYISIFGFLIVFITTFWYRRRLSLIYRDILHLFAIDKKKEEYDFFSLEADAIRLRMNRKISTSNNPIMLDPVTQINNYKGMMTSYADKKHMKDSNFTSVTIFEINNFSKQKRAFSQEFTQAILKKIAFTLSLHEQATDVIARTDYNQFTLIISRPSKEQSFKDIDIIRQSISEIKFKEPGGEAIVITVNGGFVIKTNNQHLDESLKQAREVLQHSKTKGKNIISHGRDLLK